MSAHRDNPTLTLLLRKGAGVDLNLVVLCGRLADPVEIRRFETGSRLARYLVTARSEEPRWVDIVPVTL